MTTTAATIAATTAATTAAAAPQAVATTINLHIESLVGLPRTLGRRRATTQLAVVAVENISKQRAATARELAVGPGSRQVAVMETVKLELPRKEGLVRLEVRGGGGGGFLPCEFVQWDGVAGVRNNCVCFVFLCACVVGWGCDDCSFACDVVSRGPDRHGPSPRPTRSPLISSHCAPLLPLPLSPPPPQLRDLSAGGRRLGTALLWVSAAPDGSTLFWGHSRSGEALARRWGPSDRPWRVSLPLEGGGRPHTMHALVWGPRCVARGPAPCSPTSFRS
jgi:hypothetical protein